MKIRIRGFKKEKRQQIKAAVTFFAEQLMDPRTVKNLIIDVERLPKLEVIGEAGPEDDGRYPRWFTISIRDAEGDEDIVKTLAHEMIHVKQYAKNELTNYYHKAGKGGRGQYVMKWYGSMWKPSKKEDPYWDSPWEIEAYGREVGLFHKWRKHTGDLKTTD
jgi:hypothetical protein